MRSLKGVFTCNREDMKWEISDRREESSLEGDSGPLLRVVEQKKVISNQIYVSLSHPSLELLGVGLPVKLCQSGV